MPLYEYKCPSCGKFEVVMGIREENLKTCPKCSESVTKVLSPSVIQFKGHGFYETDYKKGIERKKPEEKKE